MGLFTEREPDNQEELWKLNVALNQKILILERKLGKFDTPIILERAVEILNERKHCQHSKTRGIPTYYIKDDIYLGIMVFDMNGYFHFTPFEAIAIAEKYERENK